MRDKLLNTVVADSWRQKRRLVVPLMGFPGLTMTGSTIKLAQQNYGEHYRVIDALIERFSPDAAFPLMDLAVEANAVGTYTLFPTNDSATVLREPFVLERLRARRSINIAFDTRLQGYVETVKLMSIGAPSEVLRGAYVAGPYSLAALIMGADDAAMATVLSPEVLTELCEFATEIIQEYTRMLIAAGAQIICILEPSAVMLGPEQFERFSTEYVRHINDSCRFTNVATVYHTCGNTMHLIDRMVSAHVNVISLDSADAGVDLPAVAERVPEDVIVMGNINPATTMLSGKPDEIRDCVESLCRSMDRFPNFILSTGCDLPQETPLENIRAFMEAGRAHRVL
jgi:uroporphyrinogen decarboxylase